MGYCVTKALFRHPDKAMRIGCEARSIWMWLSTIKHICNRFILIGCQSRYIDQ